MLIMLCTIYTRQRQRRKGRQEPPSAHREQYSTPNFMKAAQAPTAERNIALRFSKRAHKHKAQSPQFTCQYVLILLRRSILALCPILSGFLAQPPPQGASFKQGTTPSFCPQISQIISCVLHHQLNGKHPSRYLRGSRPLKGTALRADPRWLHPS